MVNNGFFLLPFVPTTLDLKKFRIVCMYPTRSRVRERTNRRFTIVT